MRAYGGIFEAVKRSGADFAAQGRKHKELLEREAELANAPQNVEESEFVGVDIDALEKTEIDPDAIILLGMAANRLLYPGECGQLREVLGQVITQGGRYYMPQYHPNFIKRQSEHVRKSMEDEFVLNLEDLKLTVEERE